MEPVLMHVVDATSEIATYTTRPERHHVKFKCVQCGRETDWRPVASVEVAQRGLACPKCNRVEWTEAHRLADALVNLLAPYCERIEIGGSIRRGAKEVKDIEIVCIPAMLPDTSRLFPESDDLVSYLDRYLQAPLMGDLVKDHVRSPAWGSRYKRLRYCGMAVDLFAVRPPAQWGLIYLLRTGPADFSHRLVTSRLKGGLLPTNMAVTEGHVRVEGLPVETPEESDVFRLLGLHWIEPQDR